MPPGSARPGLYAANVCSIRSFDGGHLFQALNWLLHAAVEERQTRELQVLVSERTWGFESPPPHSSCSMHSRATVVSTGITSTFCTACDCLGLRWTAAFPKSESAAASIYVSRKADVARLDELVGPKR